MDKENYTLHSFSSRDESLLGDSFAYAVYGFSRCLLSIHSPATTNEFKLKIHSRPAFLSFLTCVCRMCANISLSKQARATCEV